MTAMHALTGVVAAATVASTGAITGLAAADTAQQQALKAQAKAAAAQQTVAEVVDRTYRTVVSESVTTAAATGGSLSPSPKPKTSASRIGTGWMSMKTTSAITADATIRTSDAARSTRDRGSLSETAPPMGPRTRFGTVRMANEIGVFISYSRRDAELAERVQRELEQAGMLAWSGRKLQSSAPMAQTRGDKTVAEMLLEDRE